ncbi:hypothetical protein EXS66_01170 [Candidatus Saccharibacteria bacterium]|nr:hypothetical protein [Candidatus Saccharibacteria bacterium]
MNIKKSKNTNNKNNSRRKFYKPTTAKNRFYKSGKLRLAAFIIAIVGSGLFIAYIALAETWSPYFAADQLSRVNYERAINGQKNLKLSNCLQIKAQAWAEAMAKKGSVSHNPNIATEYACAGDWRKLGENVGVTVAQYGWRKASIDNMEAYKQSPGHYLNIVRPEFTAVGFGSAKGANDRIYSVQAYADCGTCTGGWDIQQPAVVPDRIDTFARGGDNKLYHKAFSVDKWYPSLAGWNSLGDTLLASSPTVSSWGVGRLDVFAKNSAGYLIHKWWNGTSWSGWETFTDGIIASSPSAVSWGDRRIDVVARSSSNRLMHKWFDGTSWSGWVTFNEGAIYSDPAISSSDYNLLDVFARGDGDAIYHKYYTRYGGGWSGWQSLGGTTKDSPSAVSWGPGRIDLFTRGTDNKLYHKWYSRPNWSDWESLGGAITSAPSASSRGSLRLDVFARGSGNAVYHKQFNRPNWSGWQSLGGFIIGSPASVSWNFPPY